MGLVEAASLWLAGELAPSSSAGSSASSASTSGQPWDDAIANKVRRGSRGAHIADGATECNIIPTLPNGLEVAIENRLTPLVQRRSLLLRSSSLDLVDLTHPGRLHPGRLRPSASSAGAGGLGGLGGEGGGGGGEWPLALTHQITEGLLGELMSLGGSLGGRDNGGSGGGYGGSYGAAHGLGQAEGGSSSTFGSVGSMGSMGDGSSAAASSGGGAGLGYGMGGIPFLPIRVRRREIRDTG